MRVPDEWAAAFRAIQESPGLTVVVGDCDAGKTTFCVLLANSAFEAGLRTAIVDGDMGQSEIVPPTTIGLGVLESPIQAMSELPHKALHFVGSTSPAGHTLSTATGDKLMADIALQKYGCQLVIVDTTGLVSGVLGSRLKQQKIELLRPRHIVAIQRRGETERWLKFFDTWDGCTIHRLAPSPGARAKPPALRKQRRALKFQEYFRDGTVHDIRLDQIATAGTWLNTGTPMEPKFLKFAEKATGAKALHGERTESGALIVIGGSPGQTVRGIAELQEIFKTRDVSIIPASRYAGLVVGLTDSRLQLLALGIIREVDFRTGDVLVYTPLRSVAPVKSIKFGSIRLRPDGSEIAHLRPGDV